VKREANSASVCSVPRQIVADGVAILAVPLAPWHRKVADLIAPLAEVPGFRDKLDLTQHRVLQDDVEKRVPTWTR
jgi:hypothetical protein